ncbi:putative death-receptor fusion protein-domain-containing protein [Radiomyces spectabilis]|uniref:putative death-receptor fusion protein-domain-containing protein n=1 Tax=Radiomyces spectabilis TaxID=64574 RepID=UPI00222053BD|nr:putative death-receptor fusion protein-domain-containing protein [Radiomyces spectabilis]KAI8366706.1 putative death-receptor fusion protein-domain-containing protein [Radiomyces spectabilis]
MSISEKKKHGAKPVKFPPQVFSTWSKILDDYVDRGRIGQDHPAVIALNKLVKNRDSSWENQAACLKQVAKSLQSCTSANEVPETDRDFIIHVVQPIVSLGYFAAAENVSRRHFVPLINIISKYGNDTVLQHYYTRYIALAQSLQEFAEHSLAQKALTIYATLDFDIGKQLIMQNFKATLQFLVRGLQSSCQQLHNARTDTETMLTSTTIDQLMNDIQYLAKTLLALLSRSHEMTQTMFAKFTLTYTEDDEDVKLLVAMVRILLDICSHTGTYVKECCQVAGMALGSVINAVQDDRFARDWALGWFFAQGVSSLPACVHLRQVFGLTPPSALVGMKGWQDRDVPMLAIFRGILSGLRREVLLSSDLPEEFRPVSWLETVPKSLYEAIFISLDLICSRSDLEAQTKVMAFESLGMWLLETTTILSNSKGNTDVMNQVSDVLTIDNVGQMIHYVWDHWDDPIDAIQHKVRTIFELTLQTLEIKADFYKEQKEYDAFLSGLLKNLMMMDWHRKVKYALLNILVPKIGTDAFLQAEPDLIWKCLCAMDSLVLSPQITSLILTFLYRRVEETIPGYKGSKFHNTKLKAKDASSQLAIGQWIDLWVMPALRCLTSTSEVLRRNASGFILQPLFKLCPESFWRMMSILQKPDHEQWAVLDRHFLLHAFITILKVGRSLEIVDGSGYVLGGASDDTHKISIDTLKLAIYHADPQVRIDVFGLLCESGKVASGVTEVELEMLKLFLPLNMNCTSPEFRQKLAAHLTKIFTRLRANLYAQYRTLKSRKSYIEKKADTITDKDRQYALNEIGDIQQSIDQAKSFLFWLMDHVAMSLYPGASFQRVASALRILSVMIKIFGIEELPIPDGFTFRPEFPFRIPIATARNAKLLIDVLMNPYDLNRSLAFDILCQFPNPLPGLEAVHDVQNLLWWGLNNVVSTRAGESDSGAMVFRLVFRKYVTELGFDLYPEQTGVQPKKSSDKTSSAAVTFTQRLLDLLEKQVNIAKTNLLVAAQQHPMHGTLLALQYVIREIDYRSPSVRSNMHEWKATFTRTLALIHTVCSTVMDVLSNPSPEGNMPASFREMEEAIDELVDENDDGDSGPRHQVILSCCWRAVKEASSLLEVIISEAPVSPTATENSLLTYDDLVTSGNLFRTLLTCIRHRGAFSAVYPAYVSLNTRLLNWNEPSIAQLPSKWLDENLASLTSSNISITRRSAGLPLCILAIISSEKSSRKMLLERTMKHLLELASAEPPVDADQRIDLPQVHAYNILRTIFMDSKLGTSVLEYASDGFSLAINGFSSSSWAIRNCSVMLFSTLLQRTFGTKKTRDEHSTVNKLTGREFFTRFPKLYPYLLKELTAAVEQLLQNSMAASIHPGLYPILTLLSRMHPSVMDGFDKAMPMSNFIPLVMSCAASSIYKTREMAARALVPLIPFTKLVPTISELLTLDKDQSQNEIHGHLLQVQFLLRGHLYHTEITDVVTQFVKDAPRSFMRLSDTVFSNKLSNMTSALLLDIVGEFFFRCAWIRSDQQVKMPELKAMVEQAFQPLRQVYFDQCNQTIAQRSSGIHGVGAYLLKQMMANIITLTVIKRYREDVALTDILYLLDDNDYEVRLQTMKNLKEALDETKDAQAAFDGMQHLQSKLVSMTYGGEQSLECYVLTADLLMSLSAVDPYPEQSNTGLDFSLQQYWDQLVVQFTQKRSSAVAESVLPLLGAVLAQIIKSSADRQWIKECITIWSGFIVKYSREDMPLSLRETVVESLRFVTKDLFAEQGNVVDDKTLILVKQSMIQLLQDDDIDVRDAMASMVSDALDLVSPVHPERAVELVYLQLQKSCQDTASLQSTLMDTLCGDQKLRKSTTHCYITLERKCLIHSKCRKRLERRNCPYKSIVCQRRSQYLQRRAH